MRCFLFPLFLLAACGPSQAEFDALEQRVLTLQDRLDAIESGASPEDIRRARETGRELITAYRANDSLTAKSKWDVLKNELEHTGILRDKSLARIGPSLDVIGKSFGALPAVEKWYTGGGPEAIDVTQGTTMLVFWEQW